MNSVTLQKNQTILDVCLREAGTVEGLFELLKLNLKPNLLVAEGEVLLLPPILRVDIVSYFNSLQGSMSAQRIQFATAPVVVQVVGAGSYNISYNNAYN